jgi:hypothetical protein
MSVTAVHYDTFSDARRHFKDLLDAAVSGRPATLRRDDAQAAVVDASRLRSLLASLEPARVKVVAEAGGWSALMPGLPVAADGPSFDEALIELVYALREYSDDWNDHLLTAPNHRDNWSLVLLVTLSSDEQLKDWLLGSPQQ